MFSGFVRAKKIACFHKNQAVNLHEIFLMCKILFGLSIFLGVSLTIHAQDSSIIRHHTLMPIHIKTIPSQYYKQSLGFFCLKELQFQQKTGWNIFFRLGTKEYVDYLEQKPNAIRRF
jgi:hypothetical protein